MTKPLKPATYRFFGMSLSAERVSTTETVVNIRHKIFHWHIKVARVDMLKTLSNELLNDVMVEHIYLLKKTKVQTVPSSHR